MQLVTAHHLWLDHHPPHCVKGLLGLILLQMILVVFETKRDRSIPIYIIVAAGIGERDLGDKKNLF